MATEPNRALSPEELARKKAEEEGMLADQVFKEQHKAARDFTAFETRVPSAIEGGGQPQGEIPLVTKEAIRKAPEGLKPSLLKIPSAESGGTDRSKALLEALVNGDLDPAELTNFVMGNEKKE